MSTTREPAAQLLDVADRLRHAAVELLDRAAFDGVEVDAAALDTDVVLPGATATSVLSALTAAPAAGAAEPGERTRYRVVITVHRP